MATTTGIKPVSRSSTIGFRDGASGKTPQSPTATSTILPGPNPGERLATYFDKFFATIIGISTLGASITFTKMISTPVTPWINYGVDTITIQNWIAVSWLLWVMSLVLAALFASLLSLYRPQAIEAFATKNHHNKRRTMWAATWVSMLLFCLVAASFVFLSLVVAAYTPVGWVAMGVTATFGLVGIAGIAWQSPLEWPNWVLKLLPRSGKDEPNANATHYTKQSTFGLDEKGRGSSWPIYGSKTPNRPSILPETNEKKTQPSGQGIGANLTGGALFSAMRRNPLYTGVPETKDFGVDTMESSRMEDSQTTEKEWENYRRAGGHGMRLQPRVSWPVEGVVSNKFSPVPQQQQQREETLPQQPPPARRQPRREFKHNRRERLSQQQQDIQPQYQETDTATDAIDQRFSTYSATNRRSLPPRYAEQEEIEYEQEDDLAHQHETEQPHTGADSDIEGLYNDSTVSQPLYHDDLEEVHSEISSLSHGQYEQYYSQPQAQQHALHHHPQQIHRTVPPSRRGVGGVGATTTHRPVWEVEYGDHSSVSEQ